VFYTENEVWCRRGVLYATEVIIYASQTLKHFLLSARTTPPPPV